MQWVLVVVAAWACLATCSASEMRDSFEAFNLTASDPNVHSLYIPTAAYGKVLGFNYGTPVSSEKIAAFDLDGTLTNPKECLGNVCPDDVWNGYREWRFTFGNQLRSVFQSYIQQGYKVVIISNQSPLTYNTAERVDLTGRDVAAVTATEKKQMWIDKVSELCEIINGGSTGAEPAVPVQVFGLLDSSLKSGYYKPCSTFWNLMTENFNDNITQIDCGSSFYCGDADARLVGDTTNPWQGGADRRSNGVWSAADGQFAISSGLPFKTPEMVFLSAAAPTPSQLNQPSFTEDWCNKGDATPWCLA